MQSVTLTHLNTCVHNMLVYDQIIFPQNVLMRVSLLFDIRRASYTHRIHYRLLAIKHDTNKHRLYQCRGKNNHPGRKSESSRSGTSLDRSQNVKLSAFEHKFLTTTNFHTSILYRYERKFPFQVLGEKKSEMSTNGCSSQNATQNPAPIGAHLPLQLSPRICNGCSSNLKWIFLRISSTGGPSMKPEYEAGRGSKTTGTNGCR